MSMNGYPSLEIHNHGPTRAQAFPELHGLQGQDVSGGQEEVAYSVGGVERQDGMHVKVFRMSPFS